MAAAVKGLGMTFHEALYDISYVNLVMYSATIPDYTTKDDEAKKQREQEVVRADDPANNDKVLAILGIKR